MIYTLTLNPAIDYVIHVDNLKAGKIIRSRNESFFFGGKGINVSTVLNELSVKSVATGFIAGFTGEAIEQGLSEKGISCDFVHLENGLTRINVKIRAKEKKTHETDLNAQGPVILNSDVELLYEKLEQTCEGDTVVLAGSIPASLPEDMYEQIMRKLKPKNIRFVVDASGKLLLNTLKYNPFLIKPNAEELGEIFSVKIKNKRKALEFARKMQEKGARNVIVSMGSGGALLAAENGRAYFSKACKGKTVNTVGAGDSMVAGFLAGFEKADYEYALRLGTAAGSATAFCEGLAEKNIIEDTMKKSDVKSI